MKFSLSIADLPINVPIQEAYEVVKELKFDGVEVLPGLKSKWPFTSFTSLSEKYKIPILSVHYPFWIGKFLNSQKNIFKLAQNHSALLVLHPLMNYPLSSERQKVFFSKISFLSKEYNVPVALENLPRKSTIPLYKHFSKAHKSTTSLSEIYKICKDYKFSITLDTSHLETPDITALKDFHLIKPLIKNIHLSDFNTNTKKQHLTLGKGDLNVKKLIHDLRNYRDIITLELSPKIYRNKKQYFDEVKQSLELVKKTLRSS